MFSESSFWLNFLGFIVPVFGFWFGLEMGKIDAGASFKIIFTSATKTLCLSLFVSLLFFGTISLLNQWFQLAIGLSTLFMLFQSLRLWTLVFDRMGDDSQIKSLSRN
jgi:hypothetical protein